MSTTKDLQKQLTEALKPLKNHPEVSSFLSYLKDYDIFSSFMPYKNDLSKMTEKEKEQLKYHKAFWIINELLDSDPSIMNDKNSEALKKVANMCLSNAPQLQDIFGVPKKTSGLPVKKNRISKPLKATK